MYGKTHGRSSRLGQNIKITRVKKFAQHHLPNNSHLRELILTEKDVLPAEEFIACTCTWLRLLELETSAV